MRTTILDPFEISAPQEGRPHAPTLVDPYEIRERIRPAPQYRGVSSESWRRARCWGVEPS
jgi:hypothetical protein